MKESEFKKLVEMVVEMQNYDDVEVQLNMAYENGKTHFDTLLDYALGHIKDVGEAEAVVAKFLNDKEQGMSNLNEGRVADVIDNLVLTGMVTLMVVGMHFAYAHDEANRTKEMIQKLNQGTLKVEMRYDEGAEGRGMFFDTFTKGEFTVAINSKQSEPIDIDLKTRVISIKDITVFKNQSDFKELVKLVMSKRDKTISTSGTKAARHDDIDVYENKSSRLTKIIKEVLADNEPNEETITNDRGIQTRNQWHPEFPIMVTVASEYEAHEIVFCRSSAEARQFANADGMLGGESAVHIYEVKKEII